MKLVSTIIALTIAFCSQYAYSQGLDKSLSFNIGLNLAYPTFIYFNEESFKESIPSYQLSLNKDFTLNQSFGVAFSLGFNQNSFNAGRQIGSVYSIKQLNLSYLNLEAGPIYKIPLKSISLWSSLNLRVSRILSQNYNDYYTVPSLSSSDLGLNLKVGGTISTMPMKPYLVLNYYHGLSKIAKNSVISGNGQSLNDYISNRSVGIQVGFHF